MTDSLDELYAQERRPLWGLCYRMTGSAADADEIVQEAFARALEKPPKDASRPLGPWLRTVALNLSRDRLRRRSRTHVGVFVPEPVADEELAQEPEGSPEARVSKAESATWAFLLALEVLSDKQRAVLVLRDVYELSTKETAAALELSESHVKVLLHRARKALEEARAPETPSDRATEAMTRFFTALATEDLDAMKALLREDVVMITDGAGEVHAARKPVIGADKVVTFHRKTKQAVLPTIQLAQVNGAPALVYRYEVPPKAGVPPAGVAQMELDEAGAIRRILVVAAPSKLERFFDRMG
jgi:RNA polymerase sigma factor (sigma-70 family)